MPSHTWEKKLKEKAEIRKDLAGVNPAPTSGEIFSKSDLDSEEVKNDNRERSIELKDFDLEKSICSG